MSVTPEEFKEEWDRGKEYHDSARQMAKQYMQDHRDEYFPVLGPLSREDLAALVSKLRAESRPRDVIIVEMWLLANFEPQNISMTGTLPANVALEHAFQNLFQKDTVAP